MLFSAGHVSALAKAHAIGNLERHVWNSLEHYFSLAPKGRLGLAVSGGVDSMALASICSSYKKEHPQHNFTGLIVDHGVRPESSGEAFKVAEELQRLGIDPEILKLDWTAHGDPRKLKNFETLARRLRYQALGKACSLKGISTLQVAHHADDLAETVLSRIIARYLGEGLQGIRDITPIPECQGIWGVDGSGSRRDLNTAEDGASISTRNGQWHASKHMLIENGGVYITRPLLSFAKDQLVSVCQQHNVRWFEDSTNADETLTVRNTIRHLHRNGSLPKALRRKRLYALAGSVHDRHRLFEARAKEIYDSMAIKLDLKTARANFSLPPQYEFGMTVAGEPYHVKALLARKLLSLVSPKQDISLQDLDPAMKILFETPEATRSDAQLQGTMILKCPQRTSRKNADNSQFTLSRQNPERDIRAKIMSFSELGFDPSHSKIPWTNFLLWDNRYWIRIGRHPSSPSSSTPSEHLRFFVGFLHQTDIRSLRMSCSNSASRRALDAMLYSIGDTKWSQPLITMKVDDGKSSTIEVNQSQTIVGLPTLGWSPAGKARELRIVWDIRYKKIEFGSGDGHVLEAVSDPKDRTQQKSLVQLASEKIEQRAKRKPGKDDCSRLAIGKLGRLP